jgi:choline kinase
VGLIRRALILAAGRGGRLVPNGLGPPKPLILLAGQPILSHVLARVAAAGVAEACVVLGYRSDEIQDYYQQAPDRVPMHLRVRWLRGADSNRANGMSVLHARAVLDEPFLLLMGDHLVEVSVLRRLAALTLAPDRCYLAVDGKLAQVPDIEEATKVKLAGGRITAIGKSLAEFDAIDTGAFACSPALFEALAARVRGGDCALSDGIAELARRGQMHALDIGEANWIDIDTPEALRQAELLLAAGKFPLPEV